MQSGVGVTWYGCMGVWCMDVGKCQCSGQVEGNAGVRSSVDIGVRVKVQADCIGGCV